MALIGLLDCNNFFVSCERLFRPDLIKTPVAVLSSNDGCIVARSQEVKDMGIPMGLPLFQAKQLCDTSKVVLFSSNFTLYRDISMRVMKILKEEVGVCEVYSIDEAFFVLPESVKFADVVEIRKNVMKRVGIPVSIGLASTKTLAKEASKIAKKTEGVYILDKAQWGSRASSTACGSIWGLGRATSAKLSSYKIETAEDFMNLERSFIRREFGVAGERIYDELHGVVVHEFGVGTDSIQQSVTSSRSFASATHNCADLESSVAYHVANASAKIRAQGLVSSVMHIELRASRHSDFSHRKGVLEVVLESPTNSTQELTKIALKEVAKIFDSDITYKKAGITLTGLLPEAYVSASLFQPTVASQKDVLDAVLDGIHKKFGFAALHSASIRSSYDRSSVKLRSKSYTTSWGDIPSVHAK